MKAGLACAVFLGMAAGVSGAGASSATAPTAADQVVAREYSAQVTLDIDAAGQVSAIRLPANVPAMLAGPAREAIGRWRFKPPVREGRAMTARTYARIRLQLIRQPGGAYGLRTVYDSNGPQLTFDQMPSYPHGELSRGNQGLVVMSAIVRPDGSLTDLAVVRSHYKLAPRQRAFEKAARKTLEHAHGQAERIGGQSVATRIEVPFAFALGSGLPDSYYDGKLVKRLGESGDPGMPSMDQAIALDSPVQPLAADPGG